MNQPYKLLLACSLMGGLATLAQGTVIFSDGFESPDVGTGGAAPSPSTDSNIAVASGSVLIYGKGNYGASSASTSVAPEGVQFLSFNPGNAGTDGAITFTNFSVVAGTTYTVSFQYSTFGASDTEGVELTVTPAANRGNIALPLLDATVTDNRGGVPPAPFLTYTGTFTPRTSTTVSLALVDATATRDPNNGFNEDFLLDNLQVTAPEPAALSLFAVAAAGFLSRRRRADRNVMC